MIDWLDALVYWHWWVLGVVLLVLEMLAPGIFLLWIGLAAGAVGVLLLVIPGLSWQWQLLSFAGASVSFAVLARFWFQRHPLPTDQPHLNRRGEQYVDRIFTLQTPMVNGTGRLSVDDTTWKIKGPDCSAGSRVRVVGVDGVVLQVECVDPAGMTS